MTGFPLQALHWSAGFVGIPYLPKGRTRQGCDCWGLVWLAQTTHFSRRLASYAGDYVSPDEAREVMALIGRARAVQPDWREAQELQDGEPQDGDILLFGRPGGLPHAGVAIGGGLMLHMARERESVIESCAAPQWERRLCGFYRWSGQAECHP